LRKVAAITIVPIAFLVETANVTVPVAVTIVPGSATYTTGARRASLRTIATVAVIPITLLVEAGKLAIPISVT
jgi:hypothetical protein